MCLLQSYCCVRSSGRNEKMCEIVCGSAVRTGAGFRAVSSRRFVGCLARRHRYQRLEGSGKGNRYPLLPGPNPKTHTNVAAHRRGLCQRSCAYNTNPKPYPEPPAPANTHFLNGQRPPSLTRRLLSCCSRYMLLFFCCSFSPAVLLWLHRLLQLEESVAAPSWEHKRRDTPIVVRPKL